MKSMITPLSAEQQNRRLSGI